MSGNSKSQFGRDCLRELTDDASICNFIGAGFSRATEHQLPVSQGFLTREAGLLARSDTGEKEVVPAHRRPEAIDLLTRLERRYGELENLDLEQVMSDLYIRAFGLGRNWEYFDEEQLGAGSNPPRETRGRSRTEGNYGSLGAFAIRDDYESLLRYVRLRLRITEAERKDCSLVAAFEQSLRNQDSVVTLNYDTVLDRMFDSAHPHPDVSDTRLQLMLSFVGPPGSTWGGDPMPIITRFPLNDLGIYAKLHGSVDWWSCSEPSCPNHRYIRRRRDADRDVASMVQAPGLYVYHCDACAAPAATVMVPPIAGKPFGRFPKLTVLWLQACNVLRRARRWTFIGVSFAPTDFHLASLLRAASENANILGRGSEEVGQICVVDQSYEAAEEAAERLRGCLAPQVQARIKENPSMISLFPGVNTYLESVKDIDKDRRHTVGNE